MTFIAERTFIAVKPDGVQRGLVGEIIKRFEGHGFQLVALKMIHADRKLIEEHYKEHVPKPFFPQLLHIMTSGPVVAMVWEGLKTRRRGCGVLGGQAEKYVRRGIWCKDTSWVVSFGRKLLGVKSPLESLGGTIRGHFGMQRVRSVCHGSDSVESAKREIDLWFSPEETLSWVHHSDDWSNE